MTTAAETEKANNKKLALANAVTTSIAEYTFRNPASQKLFADHVNGQVSLTDDGQVIGDNLPLKDFVEREIQNFEGLLKPPASGGSGLNPGTGRPSNGLQIEDITAANMADPAKAAAVMKEIQRVGRESNLW